MTFHSAAPAFTVWLQRSGWRPGLLVGIALTGLVGGWMQRSPSTALPRVRSATAQEPSPPGFLALPILNYLGEDDVCRSLVGLQNLGDEAAQAVVLFWDDQRAGDPCAGPFKVECSGLLAPGATWSLRGAQIPPGSRSAMAFSVTARRLSDLGLDIGFDSTAAQYLCATLSSDLMLGDCAAYERFRAAWASGGSFAGLPLGLAAGPPLAAQVLRHCPSANSPGLEVSSLYAASWQSAAAKGPHVYLAGRIRVPDPFLSAFVHLQNLGSREAQATVAFHAAGNCLPARACGQLTVQPGASAMLSLADCAPTDGGLSIQSDEPLAVTVDLEGADSLSTVEGSDAVGWGTRLVGAMDPDAARGWSTTTYVQSPPGAERETRVRVEHLSPDGAVLHSAEQTLCPGGMLSFPRPAADSRPGRRTGTLRVSSLDGISVAAGALMERSGRFGRSGEAALVNLVPDQAPGRGTVQSLPIVAKDLDGLGLTTEIALANHSIAPGWVDLALMTYDASGPLDIRCRRLAAGQVDYIDLEQMVQIPNGFLGGMVVSPVWWSHATPDGESMSPSLSVSSILRTGTRDGEDIPGDELAVSQGIRLNSIPDFLRAAPAQRCRPLLAAIPPQPTATADPLVKDEALQAMAWLPALAYLGQDPVCLATVTVTNEGNRPAQLLWLAWKEPGFCPPKAAGPMAFGCSGLLAPGGTWVLGEGTLPDTANGGLIYSLSTATLLELELDPVSREPIASVLCQRMSGISVPADQMEGRLRMAFQTGGRFADLPLGKAWGPPITASVSRTCPADQTPGIEVTDSYAALRPDKGRMTGTEHRYAAQPILADWAQLNSALYIQNTGLSCAAVNLAFQILGDCLYTRNCHIGSLAPGETFAFDATDCVGPDWRGSVVITANEPLAIVLDQIGRDRLRSSRAGYSALAYDMDGNGQLESADVDRVRAALGRRRGDGGWDARLDLNSDDEVSDLDVATARTGICRPAQPAGVPAPSPDDPLPRLQTFLPALTGDGLGRADCSAFVDIQNLGQVPAKAILLLWHAVTADSGDCQSPSRVECSPLLAPGSSWLLPQPTLAGVGSAVAFGVDGIADPTAVLGIEADDTVADILCETLRFGVVGDCADYRRFKSAWDSKGTFAGIPFDKLNGVPLGIRVERDCASSSPRVPAGRRERSAYTGLDAAQLAGWDESAGAHVSTVPVLYANKAGINTRLWLQNAGIAAAQVEVWLQAQNDCTGSSRCTTLTVQPGAVVSVDPNVDCRHVDWQGSAWLRSTAPIAVVAETDGRGVRMAAAAPMRQPLLDADPVAARTDSVLFGPVIQADQQGWDVGVNVQNLSLSQDAWVDVAFLDGQGAPVSTFDARICAGDTETFFLPVSDVSRQRLGPLGTVRVLSRPPEGQAGLVPAPIAGMLMMMNYADPSRATLLEAVSYPLLTSDAVGPWPLGQGRPGTAVLALPGLVQQPGPEGETGELVISNLAGLPGETVVDIMLFDDKGMVAKTVRRLAAGAVEAIPLAELGIPAGFRGAALVSATSWTHRRPDRPADPAVVALAAAALTKVGADDSPRLSPGPRMAAEPGIPLVRLPGVGASEPRPPEPTADPRTPEPSGTGRVWLPRLSKGR
jgi:hypothetical protein